MSDLDSLTLMFLLLDSVGLLLNHQNIKYEFSSISWLLDKTRCAIMVMLSSHLMSCAKKIYSLILIFCTGTLCKNANAVVLKEKKFNMHISANQKSSDDTNLQWEARKFTEGLPFDCFGNATAGRQMIWKITIT